MRPQIEARQTTPAAPPGQILKLVQVEQLPARAFVRLGRRRRRRHWRCRCRRAGSVSSSIIILQNRGENLGLRLEHRARPVIPDHVIGARNFFVKRHLRMNHGRERRRARGGRAPSGVAAESPRAGHDHHADRIRFHHRFHKEEGCRPKKVCRIGGFRPPQWPTDGGCADAGFARARASFPLSAKTIARSAARFKSPLAEKIAAPNALSQKLAHFRVIIDQLPCRAIGIEKLRARPAHAGDGRKWICRWKCHR